LEDKLERPQEKTETGLIIGRNAVMEALRAGRAIDSIYVAKGNRTGAIVALIAKARSKGILIKETDGRKLDYMCGHGNHQGVVASGAVKEYASLEDVFTLAEKKGEDPFIIIADGLCDPHNLGAIIRTADCVGAHGVIIPQRHAAGLTFAVGKASAGAVEYVPVVRVSSIASTIELLKKRGVWIYAADMDGSPLDQVDFSGPLAIVIGSEGEGISRLVKEKSDFIISLPMYGQVNSLNASVACGVLCYQAAMCRRKNL
jgi:23S rRNA (guanosine2251-2'-O)-methyltransferase